MAVSLLRAESISKTYQDGSKEICALPMLTLTINRGDFLVVTGPSGAGKSTLLNLLCGFDKPSSGSVYFKGASIAEMNDVELATLRNTSCGFILQTPHLLYDRTLLENVLLPFHYSTANHEDAKTRCLELLTYVGLFEMADRFPSTLSGGELQRVVFARALACEPEIIFADEPTGSLDKKRSEQLLLLLQDQITLGRTVVMVTHDQNAMHFGNRTLQLEKI